MLGFTNRRKNVYSDVLFSLDGTVSFMLAMEISLGVCFVTSQITICYRGVGDWVQRQRLGAKWGLGRVQGEAVEPVSLWYFSYFL